MGAAAIINGNGKDLGENLQAKMDSYLWAKIRTNCEKFPHRYAIQRAMMDKNFILKAGDVTLKPSGELLTLTAQEASKSYPELPALSSGTFSNIEELLQFAFEDKTYDEFIASGFEKLAQMLAPFVPTISGIGFFLLLMEFKTPGFGLMGLLGISCLTISIMTHILAGLGGTEAIAMLGIGIACVFLDLLLLGTIFIIFIGFCFIIAGLWWSGIDVWPTIPLTFNDYLMPLKSLGYALFTWALLLWVAYKLGWIKHGMNHLTLSTSIKGSNELDDELIGRTAMTTTPLIPSGKARIDERIIEVKSEGSDIPEKTEVIIVAKKDFSWVVKRNS